MKQGRVAAPVFVVEDGSGDIRIVGSELLQRGRYVHENAMATNWPDLKTLASELQGIAEGKWPSGTTIDESTVMLWAEGWLLTLVELGIHPDA